MGIKGSPTCVLNFENATGYMIGPENKGLSSMFTMMNLERIVVGIQGLGISETAYQNALSYAKERKQGKANNSNNKDADLIILAVPVGSMKSVAIEIAPSLKKGSVVTDTGSTKSSVIDDIKSHLSEKTFFIPSHPLAGTENSGPEAGFANLFKGKYWVIVPYCPIPIEIMEDFRKFLSGTGAIVETMKPDYHDKILAITSHLPHLIAYTIVGTATDLEDQTKHDVVRFSATGFRDFTRIASSDPIMWRDVFLNNKEAVLEMLQRFSEDLTYLQRAIRWSEADKLEDLFTKTREIRRSIIKEGQDK